MHLQPQKGWLRTRSEEVNAARKAAKTLVAEDRLRAAQEIAAGIAARLANAAANDDIDD